MKIPRRVYIGILVVVLIVSIFLRYLTSRLPQIPKPLETWNDLLPERTTVDEVVSKLGQPISIEKVNEFDSYNYQSSYPDFPTQVYILDNTVRLAKQRIPPEKIGEYNDLIMRLGKEDLVQYVDIGDAFPLYVYLSKGMALAKTDSGDVFEIWYFKPMTLEEFLSTIGKENRLEPSGPEEVNPFAVEE